MSTTAERTLTDLARGWVADLARIAEHPDAAQLTALFRTDGWWRDLLALTWDIRTFEGADLVGRTLAETLPHSGIRDVTLEPIPPTVAPIGEYGDAIQFFVAFRTTVGPGRGFVRLLPDEDGTHRAFTLLTTLQGMDAHPEAVGTTRPRYNTASPHRSTTNWSDERAAARSFADVDPEVLVIGAGQAGLTLAARLGRLDVSTLVVDRHPSVGDNWRRRYHSLVLHNETCVNHMPYLPFPETYPAYIPKDMLADWFDTYVKALELNVWSATDFLAGEYDDTRGRWTVRLRLADGTERVMHPSHVVQAVGVTGTARTPHVPGLEGYTGTWLHSSGYSEDLDVAGKEVLVVGAGTSAHDVAQDIHLRGGHVTMLQRSSSTVVSLEPSGASVFSLYTSNDGVRPLEDTDLMSLSVPYGLLIRMHRRLSHQMAEDDRELLDRLRAVGFALDNGEDDTGFYVKLLRYFGGYYLNVGASDLIADGSIALRTGVGLERFDGSDVVFTDGSRSTPDVVVFSTGYAPPQETVRAMFGDEVAERVGPVWGPGEDSEMRGMWSRTGQPGLYVVGGSFAMCRTYSRFVALQIRATLDGVISPPRTRTTTQEEQQ